MWKSPVNTVYTLFVANMHNSKETDRKLSKAKSFNLQTVTPPSSKIKSELGKKKSFDLTNAEAAKSLDIDYRLKKSKLVNGECVTASSSPTSHKRRGFPEMFMVSSSTICPDAENASMMSMNFSHYELMRNLSSPMCNSEDAFSSTTCSLLNSSDSNARNEHLERYFRSVEMWSQKYRDGGPSGFHICESDKYHQ